MRKKNTPKNTTTPNATTPLKNTTSNTDKTRTFPADYGLDVSAAINQMRMRNARAISVAGSSAGHIIRYSADYDAISTYTIPATTAALDNQAVLFQQTVQRLLKTPNYVIGDIKCGEVPQWQIYDGKLTPSGQVRWDKSKSLANLQATYDAGIIATPEYNRLRQILGGTSISVKQHLALLDLDYHKIRWTPDDVLTGHRILPNGDLFTLSQGLSSGLTKLDLLAFLAGTLWTEFSMIYIIRIGKKPVVPTDRATAIASIKQEILTLHAKGNYWKLARRIYSLGNIIGFRGGDQHALTDIFNSDLGQLYLVLNDTENLLYLAENRQLLGTDRLNQELSTFVERLSKVPSASAVYAPKITKLINTLQGTP